MQERGKGGHRYPAIQEYGDILEGKWEKKMISIEAWHVEASGGGGVDEV